MYVNMFTFLNVHIKKSNQKSSFLILFFEDTTFEKINCFTVFFFFFWYNFRKKRATIFSNTQILFLKKTHFDFEIKV